VQPLPCDLVTVLSMSLRNMRLLRCSRTTKGRNSLRSILALRSSGSI